MREISIQRLRTLPTGVVKLVQLTDNPNAFCVGCTADELRKVTEDLVELLGEANDAISKIPTPALAAAPVGHAASRDVPRDPLSGKR